MNRWICLALLCAGCAARIPGVYVTRTWDAPFTLTLRDDGTFENEILYGGQDRYLVGEWKSRGRHLELTSNNVPNASKLSVRAWPSGNSGDCRLEVRDAAGDPQQYLQVHPNLYGIDLEDWQTDWYGSLRIPGELMPVMFRVCAADGCDTYQLTSSFSGECALRAEPEDPGCYWDHFLARRGIFGGWVFPADSINGPRRHLYRAKGRQP